MMLRISLLTSAKTVISLKVNLFQPFTSYDFNSLVVKILSSSFLEIYLKTKSILKVSFTVTWIKYSFLRFNPLGIKTLRSFKAYFLIFKLVPPKKESW